MKFCLNSEILDVSEEVRISAFDEAVVYGKSVFETLRTYKGDKVFACEEHLRRLFESAKILNITHNHSQPEISDALKLLVIENSEKGKVNLRIRILLAETFFTITTTPLEEMPPQWYEQGVEVIDTEFERPFPEAKVTSPAYKKFISEQPENVFETLFFDRNGYLREGNISNVFAVFGNKIVTPNKRVLSGVTRGKIIELIKSVGTRYILSLQEIHKNELQKADEIFLTNTTKEIVPIKKWGEWKNADFKVAKMLREEFHSTFLARKNNF